MNEGDILAITFDPGDNYLQFINHCFVNFLISGVHFRRVGTEADVLFITLAAPGIDRIQDAVSRYGGERAI